MKRVYRGCLLVILLFLSLSVAYAQEQSQAIIQPGQETVKGLKVGFDLDDTLLFSTPAFDKGFKSVHEPFLRRFWLLVNQSDKGNSTVKESVKKILEEHKKNGDEIFIITARDPDGSRPLIDFIIETFKIKEENIYLEPRGKKNKIKSLELDIFYGDADSDISDAMKSGAKAIRIMRSEKSWNKKKYHPGKYGEQLIENSAE